MYYILYGTYVVYLLYLILNRAEKPTPSECNLKNKEIYSICPIIHYRKATIIIWEKGRPKIAVFIQLLFFSKLFYIIIVYSTLMRLSNTSHKTNSLPLFSLLYHTLTKFP